MQFLYIFFFSISHPNDMKYGVSIGPFSLTLSALNILGSISEV